MKAGSLFIAAVAALALLAAVSVMPQSASGQNGPPDLSGAWKLDAARSDNPQKMMGGRDRGGSPEGGDHGRHAWGGGGHDGSGGTAPGGRGAGGPMHGMMRVPDRLAVVRLPDGIELRDSVGVTVERVLIRPQAGFAPVDSAGVAQLAGEWKGEKLEAQVESPRGGTIQVTYELADGGKTLKITTHVPPRGDRPALDITRVYARVSG